ncbi:MAG: type II secretion system F family protein [Thermoguttaceae bacterium]|nr:type II secretion system F family protein [Thermoguttaceae bacterium]MBR4751838.1 type II secretion system F family protein [Thermoguttaceae bacterium]
MSEFNYKAKTRAGKDVSGVMVANTKKDVLDRLAAQKLFPISVEDAHKNDVDVGKWFQSKPPISAVSAFLTQLAELLENGVPTLTAFQALGKQTPNPALREIVADIGDQVADGQSVDAAFAAHDKVFDDLTLSVIKAGSEGAFLESALKRTAKFLEDQAELRSKITSAMIYPTVLCVVGVLVVSVLLIAFVPKFEPMFESLVASGKDLPICTVWLLAFRSFCGKYGLYALGVIVALFVWARIQTHTKSGRRFLDKWKLKAPVLGPVAQASCVSKLCRVLGTLLQNGVPILRALEISSRSTGNALLQDAVENAVDAVSAGEPLSRPLMESKLIPPNAMTMISIAEESNTLEKVLINLADSLERQLAKKVDLMTRLLEPMMLLLLAGAVFYIIIALLLPVFMMTQAA